MSLQTTMEQIREWDRFSARPVTEEQVLSLLDEAVWAPNHHMREPWRFIWIAKDYRDKLGETLDKNEQSQLLALIQEAAACLIVAAPVPSDEREAKDDFAAACCLVQNLQILATASGIGMSWHLPMRFENETFCSATELQPNERFAGVLGFGYFEDNWTSKIEKRSVRIDIW